MNLMHKSALAATRPGRRARAAGQRPTGSTPAASRAPQPLDEVLLGCGWFDSSHELNTGLQVTEHLTPERVANEVPLGWWLDWQTRATPCATAAGCAANGSSTA